MATLRFINDVILADGLHRAGTEIKVDEKEASDLSRLSGVEWVDKPAPASVDADAIEVVKEPKKRGRSKKRS